jgi:hypothetical protein
MGKCRNFTILGIFSRTELPRGSLRGNAEACAGVCCAMAAGGGGFRSALRLGFLFRAFELGVEASDCVGGWAAGFSFRWRLAGRWGSEFGLAGLGVGLRVVRAASLRCWPPSVVRAWKSKLRALGGRTGVKLFARSRQ